MRGLKGFQDIGVNIGVKWFGALVGESRRVNAHPFGTFVPKCIHVLVLLHRKSETSGLQPAPKQQQQLAGQSASWATPSGASHPAGTYALRELHATGH